MDTLILKKLIIKHIPQKELLTQNSLIFSSLLDKTSAPYGLLYEIKGLCTQSLIKCSETWSWGPPAYVNFCSTASGTSEMQRAVKCSRFTFLRPNDVRNSDTCLEEKIVFKWFNFILTSESSGVLIAESVDTFTQKSTSYWASVFFISI